MSVYRRREPNRNPNLRARRPLIRSTPKVARPTAPADRGGPNPQTKILNNGAPHGYKQSKPITFTGPPSPRTTKATLYAVIGSWFEGDIIAECVRNLKANGVEKIFLVDNDSPDDTVAKAEAAGVIDVRSFKTAYYDDDVRLRLMNSVMQEITEAEKLPELWWLSLDADEFPCGPNGERVIDFVNSLPPEVNCVGCDSIDLYPEGPDYYADGMHPADMMFKAIRRKEHRDIYCNRSHWKHPLTRQRGGVYELAQSRGAHVPYTTSGLQAVEPASELTLFHAPLRRPENARKRLEALCGANQSLGGRPRSASDDKVTKGNGAVKRWRSLEAIYAGRWMDVELPHAQGYGGDITGIALYDWRKKLAPSAIGFPRWYPRPVSKELLALPVIQPTACCSTAGSVLASSNLDESSSNACCTDGGSSR